MQALVVTGTSLKDAAAEVAEITGLSRRELYEGTLALGNRDSDCATPVWGARKLATGADRVTRSNVNR